VPDLKHLRVQRHDRAATDPQLKANDIVVPLAGVDDLDATIGRPVTVHASPKVPARAGPGLGEHNDEVLADLGLSAQEIADFRSTGVIPPAAAAQEGKAP
jgi:crotonobetainyl-CoA:carnitine CoA-transferase CaiB-like acyl-CoA transferase